MNKQPYYFEIKDLITQFISAFDDVVISRYNKSRVIQDKIEESGNEIKKRNLFGTNKVSDETESINNLIKNLKNNNVSFFEFKEGDNFYVKTLDDVNVDGEVLGYIMVTEQANEILTAVEERKNFIIRTVLAIAIVIFIFLIFLNRYINKPIEGLVAYAESIKAKDESMGKIEKFLSQPFFVAEIFTGMSGKYVKLEDTIKGFNMILAGELDHLPEQDFYLVGSIDEVKAKAEKIESETKA